MLSIDKHYTPPSLSGVLLSHVKLKSAKSILDPCCGNGALLEAASLMFKNASILGNDVCPASARTLTHRRPSWTISSSNFYNPDSFRRTLVWRSLSSRKCDLALLNPPFSHRGGTRIPFAANADTILSSPAVAALALCLNYIRDGGQVLCILPSGCVHSDKNEVAWKWISSKARASVIQELGKGQFPGVSAKCTLLSLSTGESGPVINGYSQSSPQPPPGITLQRGSVPVHLAVPDRLGDSFVHTTCLTDGLVVPKPSTITQGVHKRFWGPGVIIPRVGSVTAGKIGYISKSDASVVLSDCVIGIKSTSNARARSIQKFLAVNISSTRSIYTGTGAPYTTLTRVSNYLSNVIQHM